MLRKSAIRRKCPACNGSYTVSTAIEETQFCSMACERGDPDIIYREKTKKKFDKTK